MMNASVLIKAVQAAGIAAVAATVFGSAEIALAQSATPSAPRPIQAPARLKSAPLATAVQRQPAPAESAQASTQQGDAPSIAQQGRPQGPASGRAADGGEIIARVGNVNVSADDLRSYVAALGPREQAALATDSALLSQAVRLLLANRLVLQEALAKKWDQQPAVAAQLDRLRENAVVELYLQSVTTPPADFPSDDDLQKVYDANRSAFLMPRQFQLAQIFIAVPKEGDKAGEDKAKQALDDVVRRLKAPNADFAAVAGSSSNDAKDNGDLGWVAESQIRPEIRTQVMGLAKNAVSDPIRLDDGWHILKLIETKASYTRTLPEVREQLVQQIRSERAAMLRRAYIADLQKQKPPVLNELALSNLLDKSRKH